MDGGVAWASSGGEKEVTEEKRELVDRQEERVEAAIAKRVGERKRRGEEL